MEVGSAVGTSGTTVGAPLGTWISGVGVAVGLGPPAVVVPPGVGVRAAVGVAVAVRVGVGVGVDVAVAVAVGVDVGVAVAVAVRVGVAVGVAVGAVNVTDAVCVRAVPSTVAVSVNVPALVERTAKVATPPGPVVALAAVGPLGEAASATVRPTTGAPAASLSVTVTALLADPSATTDPLGAVTVEAEGSNPPRPAPWAVQVAPPSVVFRTVPFVPTAQAVLASTAAIERSQVDTPVGRLVQVVPSAERSTVPSSPLAQTAAPAVDAPERCAVVPVVCAANEPPPSIVRAI